MSDPDQYLYSSLREGLIEHLFVGEVMRTLWLRGRRDIEVLRPITDAAGYDVVMASGGIVRHIQLKASGIAARTSRQKVNVALGGHVSGCVVWIRFDPDTMRLGPYQWFGDAPGCGLPDLGDRVARHTKPNTDSVKTERKAIRVLVKGQFEPNLDLDQVVDRLFGPHDNA